MATTIPTVVTTQGMQPNSYSTLNSLLIQNVQAISPGYTANLPGSLIEDVSSTDTAAVQLIDTARVETVNSMTPYGANAFVLTQLGNIYGVTQGKTTNTNVQVQFTGTPGFYIPEGFTVSDGTYQYSIVNSVTISAAVFPSPYGVSELVTAVASDSGSWAVPPGSVTALITSVPPTVPLTVTNPASGNPGTTAESESGYRSRVLQAGLASATGMPRFLRTQLEAVAGVQPRLVDVQQSLSGGWKVLCNTTFTQNGITYAGGDQYQIAGAIYDGLFDISTLQGSDLAVTDITQASAAVVTTNYNHNLTNGQLIYFTGVQGMVEINNLAAAAVTVIDQTEFSIAIDSTGFSPYTSGGQINPNPRTVSVSLNAFPDTYLIQFVNPPVQTVAMTVTWNTNSANYIAPTAIQTLAVQPLADYINSIYAGKPINVLDLDQTFINAVSTAIPPANLIKLVFTIYINGIETLPVSGESIINGDPESYFLISTNDITIVQG